MGLLKLAIIAVLAVLTLFAAAAAMVWFSFSGRIDRLSKLIPNASTQNSEFLSYSQLSPAYLRALQEAERGDSKVEPLQLARAVTPPSKTLKRELEELLLALRIELEFSKPEIVTMYVNQLYLGQNVVGLAAACRDYFQKDCSQVDLSEAAFLAGLATSPNRYLNHVELGVARRNEVLEAMRAHGTISSEEAAKAEAEPINIKRN